MLLLMQEDRYDTQFCLCRHWLQRQQHKLFSNVAWYAVKEAEKCQTKLLVVCFLCKLCSKWHLRTIFQQVDVKITSCKYWERNCAILNSSYLCVGNVILFSYKLSFHLQFCRNMLIYNQKVLLWVMRVTLMEINIAEASPKSKHSNISSQLSGVLKLHHWTLADSATDRLVSWCMAAKRTCITVFRGKEKKVEINLAFWIEKVKKYVQSTNYHSRMCSYSAINVYRIHYVNHCCSSGVSIACRVAYLFIHSENKMFTVNSVSIWWIFYA